jgi:hypothetical protein
MGLKMAFKWDVFGAGDGLVLKRGKLSFLGH